MSQGTKSILTIVLFLLVFANIKGALLQTPPRITNVSEMFAGNGTDNHVSYISAALNLSNDDSAQHLFELELDASGYWNMFRGVLARNNSFVESGCFKSYESNFTAQTIYLIASLQVHQKNTVYNFISISTKPARRYYLYALRHILI